MKLRNICLFLTIICTALSVLYATPSALNFNQKEIIFPKADISIVSPPRGERRIRLDGEGSQYWISCYGFDNLCTMENINQKMNIGQTKIIVNNNDRFATNGVLFEFYKDGTHYLNRKFSKDKDTLIFILLDSSVFALKAAGIFFLLYILFSIKKI